jgi:FtsH-binding integral membrane protein
MSDLETRLTAALHADEPPARDAVFRVEVLVRLEQQRFRRHVRRTMGVAALLAVLAAVSAPLLSDWMIEDGSRLWFVAVAAAAALCVLSAAMISPALRTAARGVTRLLYP